MLSELVDRCVEEVKKELEDLYLEVHYQNLLAHYLRKEGCTVESEVVVPYKTSSGFQFGVGRIDLLVTKDEECMILELKAGVSSSGNTRRKAVQQAVRYQRHLDKNVPAKVIFFATGGFKNIVYLPALSRKEHDIRREVA